MSDLQLSTWDRLVAALAHPIRALAWAMAIGTFLGQLGGPSWVFIGLIGLFVGLIGGELAGRSRIRTPWLIASAAALLLGGGVIRWLFTTYAVFGSLLGPHIAVWFSLLLSVGAAVAAVTGLLRVLGLRGPAYTAIELFVLGALFADAVASHRDGSIARPLWLSDLSWSFGVDPGRVLLVAGAVMTALLAGLLLLGAKRRKPSAGLLVLPVVALLAWFVASQLPTLEPPDPELLFAEAGGEDPGFSAGADGELPAPKPEPGENGEGGGKPEDGEDGEGGSKPEDGEGGSKPEDGGKPEDGEGGGKPEDGEGGGKPEDGEGGGKPEDGEGGASSPSDEPPDPLEGGSGGGSSPVAVVLIDDDYTPPSGTWYLRQGVLSDFNGTRLVESSVLGAHDDMLDHFAVTTEDLPYQAPLDHRAVLHGSVSLIVAHPNPFAPEAVVQYSPRANPNPARFDRSYSFISHVQTGEFKDFVGLGVGSDQWSDELLEQYLEVPDDPRYKELAEKIQEEFAANMPEAVADDPIVAAVGITQWIGENMAYSKAERHADVPDPTADFLFGNRIGYCVHTAHASVYLWRELGIPARVATGYAVQEDTRRGSVMVVKSGDAHAWSELYVTGVGWVVLDVAPAENLDPPAPPQDEEENAMLGEMARSQPDQPQTARADYSWIWKVLGYLTGGTLSSFLVVVLVLHYAVKLWRRSRPLWASSTALSRVGFRAGLDMLSETGLARASGETREAFARRLQMPALERMTSLHLRSALGGPVPESDRAHSRSEWTGLLARLRVEIAGARPWWRRWLGLLDPTSVYRTR